MRAREIVEAVASITGGPCKLHKPEIGWLEHKYVSQALDNEKGELAHGPFIQRFEDKLCEITGRKYCVAVSSGTAALHLAIKTCAAFVEPQEVRMPSLGFVATANALQYCGHTPSFDEEWPRVSVDFLGRVSYGKRPLIEDAAPALGSGGGGMIGMLAAFSFNGNKICTSGGGGSIVTDMEAWAENIRHLANVAKSSATEHDQIGFNYRMPNYNAALGLAQLERLPEFLERKATLADRYARVFGELFWKPPAGSNNWLNAILVDNRDEVVSALNEAGLESRALHAPLHTLPMYKDCPRGDMTRTMEIWNRCVCLPSGAGLA